MSSPFGELNSSQNSLILDVRTIRIFIFLNPQITFDHVLLINEKLKSFY